MPSVSGPGCQGLGLRVQARGRLIFAIHFWGAFRL